MSGQNPDPYGEIVLDGTKFPLLSTSKPQVSAVDRFPAKVTVGDYSIDSNDLLSAWVLSDLTGGHGVADLKEGVDDNRYRIGTIYTSYPNQWVKPYGINKSVIGSGSVFPLGDLYAGGSYKYYAASGTDLFEDNVDTTQNLAGVPASKAVAFRGTGAATFLYVPLGNNGYAVYDPTGPTFANINGAGDTDNFQAFCLWDNKIIGITNGGQLYYATAAANPTVWTSYGADGKLDNAFEPKALHVFYNRAGEPAVHVVTADGVWVFDAATPRLYKIPDFESRNPYFGVASCVWRGELYVGAGLDLLAYNGNVVRNVGLSRDDSLPYRWSGYIRDLSPGQNALYAMVRGVTSGGSSRTSLHEWSGFGWHGLWYKDDSSAAVRCHVSKAGTTYRLYWGLAGSGKHYYQTIPQNFTNPREDIYNAIQATGFGDLTGDTGLFPDPATGFDVGSTQVYFLETGRFNANMRGYRKVANAVELNVSNGVNYETVRVKYRLDSDNSWTTLGTAPSLGINLLRFGTADARGVYPGVPFESIEFRIEIEDNIPSPYIQSYTTVIESLVFSFLKVQNPSLAWTLTLDLTNEHNGLSPVQMLDRLTTLRTEDRFFALQHRDDTYRVRIAGVSGAEEAGYADHRGVYTVSVLEIPERLGLAPS